MLDRAFKYILSALQVHLLLMGYIIHLLLSTIHHFRIGERSGLFGLIGFGQGFVSRMKAENVSPSRYQSLPVCWFWLSESVLWRSQREQ